MAFLKQNNSFIYYDSKEKQLVKINQKENKLLTYLQWSYIVDLLNHFEKIIL